MNTAHDETNKLVLQGLVRYVRATDNSGEEVLNAKWISSRITKFEEPGTGHAVRRGDRGRKGWEGDWEIKYFEPDGNLAVMAFALNIEKHGQIYHGSWVTLEGKPLLTGFGFEEEGKLYMRYGS